jgi:hypothetical protein
LLLSHIYFSSLFPLLKLVDVDLGCLQEWGQNFDDMPPLPSENNPGGVGEGRDQGAFTEASGSSVTVILPGVSVGEPGLMHLEYVACIVPRGTRTSGNRARADDSSTSASDSKKSRSLSAQITGSMLLGEHIIVLLFAFLFSLSNFLVCSDGTIVELLESEEEDDGVALVTHR